MIASKAYIQKVMEKEELFPKKKYSQNFLINTEIVSKIVNLIDYEKKDQIVEIGPGLGALTEEIINRSYNIDVYEIDERMCKHLIKTFGAYDIFKLYEGDFLSKKINYNSSVIVVSNLPYALTTPMIEKVILEVPNIKQFIFMVQKEVIERLSAKKETKEYGPLSIFISYIGVLKKEIVVNKSCFFPIPNVDSSVFSLKIKNPRDLNYDKEFYLFLKKSFTMRRKTLINNLLKYYNKEKIIDTIMKMKLPINVRPEEIAVNDYLELFDNIVLNKGDKV